MGKLRKYVVIVETQSMKGFIVTAESEKQARQIYEEGNFLKPDYEDEATETEVFSLIGEEEENKVREELQRGYG